MTLYNLTVAYFLGAGLSTIIWAVIGVHSGTKCPSGEAVLVRLFVWPYFTVTSIVRGFCKGWVELHPDWHGERIPKRVRDFFAVAVIVLACGAAFTIIGRVLVSILR